ncbi:TetR/AcrR family transcriptional regulator [Arthrobacter sp. SA17]
MEPRSSEPQRSDAQRNRERILAVALEELSRSVDVPLSAIAKKAGVGQGTFYRNFPNREALVLEVYQHEVSLVTDGAAELLRTRPPQQALREWMDQLARFAAAKIGLSSVMRQIVGSSEGTAQPGYGTVLAAVEAMLEANHQAGTIRREVTAEDFILAIAGIWQLDAHGDGQARAARVLDIVMYGITARAPDHP